MKPLAVACALAVFVSQTGCGQGIPSWRLSEPPSEDLRRTFGRVAVVLESELPAAFPYPPVAGPCSMSAVGALTGLAVGFGIGASICSGTRGVSGGGGIGACLIVFIVLVGLAVAVAAGTLGALIGAADGAAKGRSSVDVERGRRVLEAAAARAAVPALLRAQILERMARETRIPVVELGLHDTLLVIRKPEIALAGPLHADPPLRLFGQVRFQLRKSGRAESLHELTLGFAGGVKSFDVWVAEEGDSLRRELLGGMPGLAERAVEEFFLLERGTP